MWPVNLVPNEENLPSRQAGMQGPAQYPPAPVGLWSNLRASMGGGPEAQYYEQRGLLNPYAVRGGQAVENIRNWGNPGVSRSPVTAYQTAVAQNAATLEARRRSDPFFEYEEAQRRGIIPEDMTFQEFRQIGFRPSNQTAVMKNFNAWKALNPEATPEEARSAFNALAVSPSMVAGGGGQQLLVDRLGGVATGTGPAEVVSAETATQQEASEAAATAGAESWARADAAWEQAYPAIENNMLEVVEGTASLIDLINANPDMSTGFIEGRITPMTNAIVAKLDAISTILTIPELANAKLAPVTESEIETVRETFASVRRDPQANIGALVGRLEMMAPRLENLQRMIDYYLENGTMQGFIGNTTRGSRIRGGLDTINRYLNPSTDDEMITIDGIP